MLKNSFFIVFVLLIISIFSSCKKDQAPIVYPLVYKLTQIVPEREIQLYVNKKLVTDAKVKYDFIGEGLSAFNLQNQSTTPAIFHDIIFTSPDTMQFSGNPSKYNIVKTGNNYLFPAFSEFFSFDDPYFDQLLKYGSSITAPYTGGFWLMNYAGSAVGTDKILFVNFMSYKYVRHRVTQYSNYRSSSTAALYNEVNDDFIKNQGVDDTLAIQRYRLTYKSR